MPVPDYQSIMLPLLRHVGDGKEYHHTEVSEALAVEFKLTEEEKKALLPSGQQYVFENRTGWAITYLKKAGLLVRTKRGCFMITERGEQVLKSRPDHINAAFLRQYPEFVEFQAKKGKEDKDGPIVDKEKFTPEEAIEAAHQSLRTGLSDDLVQLLKKATPAFFERLVVDLLLKMGYGGSQQDAGKAIGKSGDEGIDGIIKEDKLGLEVVYIQAKRWEGTVSRPEIQKFAGALQGQRAKKGIFITTSDFTKEAREYASRIESKIVLIDGAELAGLLIDNGIGVRTTAIYEVKRVDQDYFLED